LIAVAAAIALGAATAVSLVVDVAPGHAANRIVPMRSIGAGLDAENPGADAVIYGPADVSAMLSAGLGPITYRLYTELAVQAWHWNPNGVWSDPARHQGYWTGSRTAGTPIENSYGYRLPQRGFTHDAANDDDYSRLDDGDAKSYWKSDPYLAQRYTGESDALHPQWAVVEFPQPRGIDAIRIAWANPYAVAYRVQYWTGEDPFYAPAAGRWVDFPRGVVTGGSGGTVTLSLADAPLRVQFVRVEMSASSNTCDSHGAGDPRNCAGYAIDELGIGTLDGGTFHDDVIHAPGHRQTVTYVSSNDPWHTAADRDTYDEVQPGLDAVFQSGISRGLPAMVAVSMLYGTPDDAAAEVAYLEGHGYPLRGVELGEEPDGQHIVPEDYAALYVQWARAIHAVDPQLPLGGPVFQGVTSDVLAWRNASGDASWLHRFLLYLRAHGALGELGFMSFEHYPFDPCDRSIWGDLRREPGLASGVLDVWRRDGVPANVPFYVTEMNFSAYAGEVFQDVPGALWFADATGALLTSGASSVYLYQYAPEPIVHFHLPCETWGAYGMFTGTKGFAVRQETAQYFAAQMLMFAWAQPVDAAQTILHATASSPSSTGTVASYAILRPDGQYAVMLVNKDPTRAAVLTLRFVNGSATYRFTGNVYEAIFGRAQYVWNGNGPTAYAQPDGPIVVTTLPAAATYRLEPGSITVLRGNI
jgi:hypothetical protein